MNWNVNEGIALLMNFIKYYRWRLSNGVRCPWLWICRCWWVFVGLFSQALIGNLNNYDLNILSVTTSCVYLASHVLGNIETKTAICVQCFRVFIESGHNLWEYRRNEVHNIWSNFIFPSWCVPILRTGLSAILVTLIRWLSSNLEPHHPHRETSKPLHRGWQNSVQRPNPCRKPWYLTKITTAEMKSAIYVCGLCWQARDFRRGPWVTSSRWN